MKSRDVSRKGVELSTPLGVAWEYLLTHDELPSAYFLVLKSLTEGRTKEAFGKLSSIESEFSSVVSVATHQQMRALIEKFPFKGDIDQKSAAIESFWRGESRCRRANDRLRWYGPRPSRGSPVIQQVMGDARRLVELVIGELTPDVYLSILEHSRPGPGISGGTRDRMLTAPAFKYLASDLCCTREALPFACDLVANSGYWREVVCHQGERLRIPLKSTRGNRVTFVPKNAKTLRSIAVEPNLNVMLQLGVHEVWRKMFLRHGVTDLQNQHFNQAAAYYGSIDTSPDGACTIDLEAASDSVSTELVRWMLPESWFWFLDRIRSKEFQLNGSWYTSEKFSTMGNGFTFALETLIFWALAKSCCDFCRSQYKPRVYGDDIVIPKRVYPLLVETLKHSGLVVNTAKSHVFGPFRESCGANWHSGVDTTPIYVRERLDQRGIHSLFNRWKDPRSKSRVRKLLLALLPEHMWGLENEDPGSCLFTSLRHCKAENRVRFDPHLQTYRYVGLVEVGRVARVSQTIAYGAALLSGTGTLHLRGVSSVRRRYLTPGQITYDRWSVGGALNI